MQPTWGMPWDDFTLDHCAMAAAYEMETNGTISRDVWELGVWMKAGWTVVDLTNQVGFMEKLQVRKVSFYVAHTYV